jgi:hypothetical protein
MTIHVDSEATIVSEAAHILLEHLSPVKVARFWASWQIGHGDYLQWREEAFGAATVDELYTEIVQFQDEVQVAPKKHV